MRWVGFVRNVMLGREGVDRALLLTTLQEAGAIEARSHLTTGNVTFEVGDVPAEVVAVRLEEAVTRVLGRPEIVALRRLDWLRSLVAAPRRQPPAREHAAGAGDRCSGDGSGVVHAPAHRGARVRRILGSMAYDEELAARIRDLVEGEPGLTEKRMFGGLAFLVHGNMAVAASGQGGILLRVDPADTEALVDPPAIDRFVMRGRAMDGWLHLAVEAVPTEDALRAWVARGVDYARSLPPK